MTIYKIDLLRPESLKGLPSGSEIFRLCRYVCLDIIRFLLYHFETHHRQNAVTLLDDIATLNWCMDILEEADPRNTEVSHSINILKIAVEKQVLRSSCNSRQTFTLYTLKGVHTATLVNLISTILENSLMCVDPSWYSLPEALLTECTRKIRKIILDLTLIFPEATTYTQPDFVLARLTVEFQDHLYDVKTLV
jgi:hypothetical protein